MRMCDLAESVLLSRSGLTRLVDRLEREGLVARDSCEQDARGSFAVLTGVGEQRAARRARDAHSRACAGISSDASRPRSSTPCAPSWRASARAPASLEDGQL